MSKDYTHTDQLIIKRIYEIRGQNVMLDKDLAELYGVETRVLKQTVRRNIKRFPEDFMFEMSKQELEDWRSQYVTSNKEKMGLRYTPFCFTELGVTMLASVIRSDLAIHMNIRIVRIFSKLREFLFSNKEILFELDRIKGDLKDKGKDIELIFKYLRQLEDAKKRQLDLEKRKRIGFKRKEEE